MLEAKVLRADGTIEDLGEIGYYHHNPVKRAFRNFKRQVRTRRWGTLSI